ncbi:MAG: DUF975 family protein [Clostridia bacterium]
MEYSKKQLKQEAKKVIKNNFWNVVLLLVVMPAVISALYTLLVLIPVAGVIVAMILSLILTVAMGGVVVKLSRGEKLKVSEIFVAYKVKGMRNAWAMFMNALIPGLWSLALIVPGIIKAYALSMVAYILAEDSEISGKEARRKSTEMMKGHKMQLFGLQFSFILLYILCSLGIMGIYLATAAIMTATVVVLPESLVGIVIAYAGTFAISTFLTQILFLIVGAYVSITTANFYRVLKGESLNAQEDTSSVMENPVYGENNVEEPEKIEIQTNTNPIQEEISTNQNPMQEEAIPMFMQQEAKAEEAPMFAEEVKPEVEEIQIETNADAEDAPLFPEEPKVEEKEVEEIQIETKAEVEEVPMFVEEPKVEVVEEEIKIDQNPMFAEESTEIPEEQDINITETDPNPMFADEDNKI